MTSRTPATLLLLALAAAAVSPSAAGAELPVAIYPLESSGLAADLRTDVQGIVESAVRTGERRGAIRLRTPAFLAATCGARPADACLAGLAKGGAVLVPRARMKNGQVVVTIAFVDGTGRRTQAAAFSFDPFLQDLRAAVEAVAMVEAQLGSAQEASSPQEPRERPEDAAESASEDAPAAPSAAAPRRPTLVPTEPTPLARAVEPAGPSTPTRAPAADAWKGTVGRWTTLAGVVLLAGATTTGLLGRKLNEDLTYKYQTDALVPGDSSSYEKLDTYALVTNVLLVAGGVATVTGITLWANAPDESPARRVPGVGVMGRF